jgi:hypothetical protein
VLIAIAVLLLAVGLGTTTPKGLAAILLLIGIAVLLALVGMQVARSKHRRG